MRIKYLVLPLFLLLIGCGAVPSARKAVAASKGAVLLELEIKHAGLKRSEEPNIFIIRTESGSLHILQLWSDGSVRSVIPIIEKESE